MRLENGGPGVCDVVVHPKSLVRRERETVDTQEPV